MIGMYRLTFLDAAAALLRLLLLYKLAHGGGRSGGRLDALKQAKTVSGYPALEHTRSRQFQEDSPHRYVDRLMFSEHGRARILANK